MGCQTLHDQFIIIHSLVTISLVFMLKNSKGLSVKDILGISVTLCNSFDVLPFNNIIEEHEELQQCLVNYSIEDWDVDCLDFLLFQLGLDFDFQKVLLFVRNIYHYRIFIERYWGWRTMVLEDLESFELRCLDLFQVFYQSSLFISKKLTNNVISQGEYIEIQVK